MLRHARSYSSCKHEISLLRFPARLLASPAALPLRSSCILATSSCKRPIRVSCSVPIASMCSQSDLICSAAFSAASQRMRISRIAFSASCLNAPSFSHCALISRAAKSASCLSTSASSECIRASTATLWASSLRASFSAHWVLISCSLS